MKKKHIVSVVFNSVEGDSRVIKTAKAALNYGYNATIVGISKTEESQRKTVEGVSVVLVPNFALKLKDQGLWGAKNKNLRLLVGGQLQAILPEIIALKPDLLHSHDMNGLKIGATVNQSLISRGIRIPWVHDLHEFVAGLRGETAEQFMPVSLGWEVENVHTPDKLFTVSDALAEELFERYSLEKKPTVTYNTPCLGAHSETGNDIRSAIGLPNDIPLVVFTGVAKPLRGCDVIIKAVARLKGVHLAFLSQGKYVEKLVANAPNLGLKNRVHAHPYVPSDQVTSFIRTADVGVHGLHHYPNAEVAMPNKLFEYLLAGLPIVVSDVASMSQFVEKYGIGESFIANDAASCAEHISSVLKNREQYTKNITQTLKQQYSWEEQEKKLQVAYRDLLTTALPAPTEMDKVNAFHWQKLESVVFDATYAKSLSDASLEKVNAMNEKLQLLLEGSRVAKSSKLGGRQLTIIERISLKIDSLKKYWSENGLVATIRFIARRFFRVRVFR